MASEQNSLFYPYQQRWIGDDSRFKIGMFSRQSGKTFCTTFEIAQDCQLADLQGKRQRWVILSRGERQAKEAMEEGLKRHAQALGSIIKTHETTWHGDASYRALEVEWPNGSKVTALPANPDTARGFSANVFLDEFAFHQDSRKIWTALFPVISAGWNLRVVSTPNGKGNKFYDLVTDNDPDTPWSRHIVDIYQAVKDGLPRDINLLKKGIRDPDAWAQEYELKWLDEASAWLPYELISECEHDQAGQPEAYTGGPVYIGNDIAARNDLWCAWVWEKLGDVLWCREIVTLKRASFATQDAEIDRLMRRYDVRRLCMDQTGMGEKPVEDAQRRYGRHTVEGVLFSATAKQHMATLAKQAWEDRKVRTPLGDAAVRDDLHSLRKITTPAGNIRFDVDGGDGHADRAWAAFLGVYAAARPHAPIEFTAAPGKHARRDQSDRAARDYPTESTRGAW